MGKLPKLFQKLRFDYVCMNIIILTSDARVVNLNVIKKIEQNYEKKWIDVSLKGIQDKTRNIKRSLTPLAIKKWNYQWAITTYLSGWLKLK